MAALVWIAPELGAVLAAHVSLQLVDRRRLRPPDVIQRDGLMRIAAETLHFEIEVTGVERIAEGRRRSAILRASVARSAAARTEPP